MQTHRSKRALKPKISAILRLTTLFGVLALAGCGSLSGDDEKDAGNAAKSDQPSKNASDPSAKIDAKANADSSGAEAVPIGQSDGLGTPMAERVATIGFLNKRNNEMRELEMKPGEALRIDNVVIRMEACERTAPWETPAEEGAFLQVLVQDKPKRNSNAEPKWRRIFSGWLFKESPSVNVVEHPIYDVWIKKCAMRFPGEEDILVTDDDDDLDDSPAFNAPSSGNDSSGSRPRSTNRASESGNEGNAAPARRAAPAPAPATPEPVAPSAPSLPEPSIEDLLDDVDG